MAPYAARRLVRKMSTALHRFPLRRLVKRRSFPGRADPHEHLSGWVGRPVDPAEFDLAFVILYRQSVRARASPAEDGGGCLIVW